MSLPEPVPGLVIRYAYLWRDEALKGREEGRKDRPCVIVLAVQTVDGRSVVTVAPVTHTPPDRPEHAVEISSATKRRLGMDVDGSWIIASDLNRFVWPGPDLRPTGPGRFAFGLLPSSLFDTLKGKVLDLARAGRVGMTSRTSP